VGVCVIGFDLQGAAVGRLGLGQASALLEQDAQVVVGTDVIGFDRQDTPVSRLSLG
jgi:hypothetical protein